MKRVIVVVVFQSHFIRAHAQIVSTAILELSILRTSFSSLFCVPAPRPHIFAMHHLTIIRAIMKYHELKAVYWLQNDFSRTINN